MRVVFFPGSVLSLKSKENSHPARLPGPTALSVQTGAESAVQPAPETLRKGPGSLGLAEAPRREAVDRSHVALKEGQKSVKRRWLTKNLGSSRFDRLPAYFKQK